MNSGLCPDTSTGMPRLNVPERFNYIGVFLTLDCNLRCSYCINTFNGRSSKARLMSGDDWILGLNRIIPRTDLPISLQGGEPTLHPDFYTIVNGLLPGQHLDLLTNLEFDTDHFMRQIPPERMFRESPYASIRVSYHPEAMNIEDLAARVLRLQLHGYHIGVWGVLHPGFRDEIVRAQAYCTGLGIDFRTKEFLGVYNGKMYGNLSFKDACDRKIQRRVECRTTELLIGPGGDVYRCHSDLYQDRHAVGHILDTNFVIDDSFRPCDCYGSCNPCDVKLKTNRFQEFGHTSVEIKKSDLECVAQHDGNPGSVHSDHSGSGTGT